MVSYTPFLNLAKPADGEPNWGSHINADLDILDEAFNDIADSFDKLNVVKLGGYPISLGPGVVGTGTARILIANDDTLSTTIVTNTGNQASASTSIASVFSAPLDLKIIDDLDLQIGIDSRGLSIYNPVLNNIITPLYGYLTSSTGSYWDTGSGSVTPNTLRNVHASDDLASISVESIDEEFGKSLTTATLPNSEVLKIGNVVLRDICGIFTGVIDKPLYISLVQGSTPLIFDFGSGSYSSNTLRTVSSTNDPNLSAIKTASETLAASTNQSGYSAPPTILLGGRSIYRRLPPTGIPGQGGDTEIVRPLLGNDQGLYTHVKGGSVNAILKDDNNETVATKQSPLFYRNSDVSTDRGQASSKPFFNAITNPLVIGNGVNVVQLGGYAISRMRGIIGEGTQRVCIADDDTNLSRIVVLLDIIISLLDILIEDDRPTYVVVSSVYGGSGVIAPPAMIVEEGDAATFYMVPSVGWQINAIRLDGQVQGTRSNMFIVPNVKSDRTISVEFTELPEETHTITASAIGHGSIVPAGNIVVGDGDNYIFNFVSDSGYRIDNVTVDGVVVSPDTYTNSFTFVGVTSDHTISVTYEAIPIATYTITASATGNGTVSPSGVSTYNAGNSATYYISPTAGYSITSVLVDGSSIGSVTSYTFQNIYANHTISASFGQNQYLIDTSVVGGNGSITPSKIATLGENVTVYFYPNSGYKLKTVTVDGSVISVSTNSYTFSNISGPHRITVEFGAIPINTYKISAWVTNKKYGTDTMAVHPIFEGESIGTISPAGDTYHDQGTNQTFTLTAAQYRYIDDVKVDGISVGAVSTYTFSNIQSNHTIEFISARHIVELSVTTDAYSSLWRTVKNAIPSGDFPAQTVNKTTTYTVWMGGVWMALYSITDGHTLNSVKFNGANVTFPTNLTIGTYPSGNGNGVIVKPVVNATNSLVFSTGVIPAINYTITTGISEGTGTISPNAATVAQGGSSTFSITPGTNYSIKSVAVDGTSVGSVSSYTFSNVQSDHTLVAGFEYVPPVVTRYYVQVTSISQTNGCGDTGYADFYFINVPHVTEGTAFDKVYVNSGGSATVSLGVLKSPFICSKVSLVDADTGYPLGEINIGSRDVIFVVPNVTRNIRGSLWIESEYHPPITIVSSAGSGGSITPLGSKEYLEGATPTYTATANTNFRVAGWVVDSTPLQLTGNTYTFDPLTTDHTISVNFAASAYTVTTSAGSGGSIAPDGSTTVSSGDSFTAVATPATNYAINRWVLNGVAGPPSPSNTYTLSDIKSDNSVYVSFKPIASKIRVQVYASNTEYVSAYISFTGPTGAAIYNELVYSGRGPFGPRDYGTKYKAKVLIEFKDSFGNLKSCKYKLTSKYGSLNDGEFTNTKCEIGSIEDIYSIGIYP